ncbi:soma ferritin-like isoform X1 [Oratosquilla oratoria]|uniref:soma ferritin-like isoform X1 n=1 Tax=Oratosquilla oratoria TaxID=337810 RepID=UPI003F770A8D
MYINVPSILRVTITRLALDHLEQGDWKPLQFTLLVTPCYISHNVAMVVSDLYSKPFHDAEVINENINFLMNVSYLYLAMGYYFCRPEVALCGFSSFFKKMSKERYNDAERFIEFVSRRGGDVKFEEIGGLRPSPWRDGVEVFEIALSLEEDVYRSQLDMHQRYSGKNGDPQLRKFIEDHLIETTIEVTTRLKIISTRLKRSGDDLRVYHVDRELGGFKDAQGTCTFAPHEAWGGGA